MTQKEKILCRLLAAHLWDRSIPEGAEFNHQGFVSLMETALKQTVQGLMGRAMADKGVRLERVDGAQLFLMLGELKQNNQEVSEGVVALCRLLKQADIPLVVVKGQSLGALYPASGARTPGDIDFYVAPQYFDRAKTVIEQAWEVEMEVEESEQHYHFMRDDNVYEMHFNLMAFASSKLQKRWNALLAAATPYTVRVLDEDVPTLPPTLNLVYTFLHLYHHLVELGVGLRQFCDVGILLHRHRENIDREQLVEMLTALDFLQAFRAVEWLLVNSMGLPPADCAVAIDESDARYEEDLLDIVFTGGNFGKYGLENGVRSGVGYYFETARKKLGRYRRLYSLAPTETRASLFGTMPKKIWQALTGKI